MSSKFDSYQKRRLRSSYFSVVISIALVLFMVGFLGLVLLKSTQVANHFKEEVVITLFLKNDTSKEQIENLRTSLLKELFTRKIIYISKGDAAKFYAEDLGEDFVNYLGTNPLKNSIDIYLNPGFVTPEKMQEISDKFNKNSFVFEVSYDKPLVTFLTQNIQKVSFWLFAISSFFGLVALILINSSIRLSVYSKRFNIKTMQMVGATKGFIRKPFIWSGVRLGFIGAIISLAGLAAVIYYIDQKIPTLQLVTDYVTLAYLGGGILLIAFIISWLSTFFATQRFLNLQTDELYY
ncbi:permease-like cell division protein FtsX [Flavobacteriaceae bacterium]|jgi:cell division transport system permease protein|nr:permease-like cell division protein FtsX [Flavobacteriaceae bacterium]MDA9327585.1 permease-like cell division protein FtsX [Flavobacteriaceae bacterium]MDA9338067.1 permease-like cell division protein FtsX [Flavobacteriaceae bacterium]MDB4192206.1 permease-like cell division protein FtsX [Flavobacteriaceae bacterium]MDB9781147.1 permease-like cell division protein FtsX [Flavobacteriaceae bacterium]|tara:strand:+ start:2205 stop:3083 length:879 start_codon:yes stop_codon:yes gene_type:complete